MSMTWLALAPRVPAFRFCGGRLRAIYESKSCQVLQKINSHDAEFGIVARFRPRGQQRAFLASRVIPAARRHDCKTHQPMSQSSPASRHWRRASMQLTARCGTAMSLAMASSCAAIATHATVQNARIISLSSYTNTQLSFFATNSLLAKSMQLTNTRTSALRRGFG